MRQPLPDALLLYAIVDIESCCRIFGCGGLTDTPDLPKETILTYAKALLQGGVRAIQLRDKRAEKKYFSDLAAAISEESAKVGAYFFVNDDAELAHECGAAGVHLGVDDMAVRDAKKRFPNLLIGASARSLPTAKEAQDNGADYLGCGPLWDATATKPDLPKPIGLEQLKNVVRSVSIPVVGIGGVDAINAPSVLRAGAAGVAMVRALMTPDSFTSDSFDASYDEMNQRVMDADPLTSQSPKPSTLSYSSHQTDLEHESFASSVRRATATLLKDLQNGLHSEITGPLS